MMDESPRFYDAKFRRKRKHDKWQEVEAPKLQAPVADTHAHVQLLDDPPLELARAGANGVSFICTIVDTWEDGTAPFEKLDDWLVQAGQILDDPTFGGKVPHVRIATGCHPHNAKHYDEALEATLKQRLHDPRIAAVGEIGLDYHYDFSPRDVQREVFRRQIRVAKEAGLPVILHLREAHDDGFEILQDEGFPEAGTLLHCFNLDKTELVRWVEAGCYIAYGGPLTFKKADDVREAARLVPLDRLLTETDSPYMTPEPMRGVKCGPAHVIFTAEMLAEVWGMQSDAEKNAFLTQVYNNALSLLDRAPTFWQLDGAQS